MYSLRINCIYSWHQLSSQTQYPMTTCDWILLPRQNTICYTDLFQMISLTPSLLSEKDSAYYSVSFENEVFFSIKQDWNHLIFTTVDSLQSLSAGLISAFLSSSMCAVADQFLGASLMHLHLHIFSHLAARALRIHFCQQFLTATAFF